MNLFIFITAVGLILLMPLAGILLTGGMIQPYLDFPPQPVITFHPPFSAPVFLIFLVFILVSVLPFLKKGLAVKSCTSVPYDLSLPWWGISAFLGLAAFWVLAWTRRPFFPFFQPHTFFPLWLCWIICLNALTYRASGQCLLLKSPFRFMALFFVSACFWWIFEYLNRFVGNWYYSGSRYSAGTYFVLAFLSFSTVLPAVESMKDYLLTFSRKPHAFTNVKKGDYTLVTAYASASLVCGFFWEMFNFYSLARWQYSIPYVQVLHLFEMPILGYAGYLPFGLGCGLIIGLVLKPQ